MKPSSPRAEWFLFLSATVNNTYTHIMSLSGHSCIYQTTINNRMQSWISGVGQPQAPLASRHRVSTASLAIAEESSRRPCVLPQSEEDRGVLSTIRVALLVHSSSMKAGCLKPLLVSDFGPYLVLLVTIHACICLHPWNGPTRI